MTHVSPAKWLMFLICLLVLGTPLARAQTPDPSVEPQSTDEVNGGDIDFDMEGMEDFGDENFQVDNTISMEDAARATKVAIAITAVGTGIPALFVGGVAGYLLGRRKRAQ